MTDAQKLALQTAELICKVIEDKRPRMLDLVASIILAAITTAADDATREARREGFSEGRRSVYDETVKLD